MLTTAQPQRLLISSTCWISCWTSGADGIGAENDGHLRPVEGWQRVQPMASMTDSLAMHRRHSIGSPA